MTRLKLCQFVNSCFCPCELTDPPPRPVNSLPSVSKAGSSRQPSEHASSSRVSSTPHKQKAVDSMPRQRSNSLPSTSRPEVKADLLFDAEKTVKCPVIWSLQAPYLAAASFCARVVGKKKYDLGPLVIRFADLFNMKKAKMCNVERGSFKSIEEFRCAHRHHIEELYGSE